ncbi:MAG: 23S rRNA (uracil(1939)-C(5))-methyltransferase RlmD [Fusobacteriaceae bacterium]
MNLNKGDKVEITIDKLVYGGEGLGYLDGFALFVPMSVPGDRVEVEVISLKKRYGRALIKKIITPGSERISSDKISFEDYHGCDFAMLNYDAQLKYKQEMVEDVIRKIGRSQVEVPAVVGADDKARLYYRNKIIEPFSFQNGEIITGFFKKKSHDIFQVEENTLNSKLGNKIIARLKKTLNNLERKISVYDENSHRGVLRHVMVRTNSKNEAMVVLIVNAGSDNPLLLDLLKKISEEISEIKSIYISVNREKTNFALGRENIHIGGELTLKENLFGIEFNISPTSFFQINIEQTKKLYQLALDFSNGIESKNVVDAYSGTGTIAMILSKKAKEVFAIEIVKSATEDGIKTARENGIKNIKFINGGVEIKLQELLKKNIVIDSIFLDPPRKGVDEESLVNIANTKIEEIIYISCNPSTLARDSEILERNGYLLQKIQPVDLFPQTSHIECVAKFILKNNLQISK